MAQEEHLKILKQGVEVWNKWRKENLDIKPDLVGANLSGMDLRNANLSEANLSEAILRNALLSDVDLWMATVNMADLSDADLRNADLRSTKLKGANLSRANLSGGDISEANLSRANLSEAFLSTANLRWTNFKNASLVKANLMNTNFVKTQLESTNLSNCYVYGISVWDLKTDKETKQSSLVITDYEDPVITVDNLEVAQFIYLLLHNEKIRHAIDTITSKVVLILGRFTETRITVLDAIRDELRKRDYLPVLFDFDKPASRDLTETISTLAHMARFIIADITDAKSIPQELQAIVPNLPSVPVQPLLLGSGTEYGMFEHFRRYPWVLEICRYHDQDELIQSIETKVIAPAEEKAKALMK